MVLKVGVTGGIGSGKTEVCKIFSVLGIPVFSADITAKELLNSSPGIRDKLVRLFGEGIYTDDGLIDRKKFASLIFNDNFVLAEVNRIIHPEVREAFENWAVKQDSAYVVHEAAILFESGFYKLMDYNILVSANEENRIKRVMNRDVISEKQVRERMDKQWGDDKKIALADTVIYNNNELLIPQVLEADKKIRQYGKIR